MKVYNVNNNRNSRLIAYQYTLTLKIKQLKSL